MEETAVLDRFNEQRATVRREVACLNDLVAENANRLVHIRGTRMPHECQIASRIALVDAETD
jgi:hypothetical protein